MQEKALGWSYDAMKIEVISLGILTLIHGKNLWYFSDTYPVALFLFMVPITIVALFDYVFNIRVPNDYLPIWLASLAI